MKLRFIFNPCSGRNRRRPWLAGAIQDFIRERELEADFVVTQRPGHATELAREAVEQGCARVVAIGGDGTMNEAAQGLVDTPVALALVPCGSGNGLALHLGLPRPTMDALALAADAGSRHVAIDTGAANGRPFFNAMGFGLDAEISHRFNRLTRRGLPAYARTAVQAMRERENIWCIAHGGGRSVERQALIVAVANSDQYGNNARIAPGARVDDGALDLVLIEPVGLIGAAALAARMFLGTLDASPRVRHVRAPRFEIERAAPGLIHTDGETHAIGADLEVVVRPASLRIVVPDTCPLRSAPAAEPAAAPLS